MVNKNAGSIRPLCPQHRAAMISRSPLGQSASNTAEIIETHGCECPVEGCSHMYSLSLGYFTAGLNNDYWSTTRSPSLRVVRWGIQALCGEHKGAMFVESFDRLTDLAKFRCPQNGCQQTMNISISGPPTYWLGAGYFGQPS